MVLEAIFSPGISDLSHLIGDASAGIAAVIDPRRDVDVYVEPARALGVRITTQIHADFVSGSRELTERTGLLEREDFRDVHNVPGSIRAWKAAGYPMEGENSDA